MAGEGHHYHYGVVWFKPKPTTPNLGLAKILAKLLPAPLSPARGRKIKPGDQNFGEATLPGLQSKRLAVPPVNAHILVWYPSATIQTAPMYVCLCILSTGELEKIKLKGPSATDHKGRRKDLSMHAAS